MNAFGRRMLALALSALLFVTPGLQATSTPHNLAGGSLSQNWNTTTQITANDDWSGVPSIQGFLGQDLTTSTGTDPQTILTAASAVANDLTVLANQTNTAITNGDVAEFHTTSQAAPANANPTIALQGSGTADAPHIILYLNTTGRTNVNVAYTLRDIDCTTDNAVMPVALQYRVGGSGNFVNVPAGFVADATTGPSLCTATTNVNVTLPAAVENQSLVEVRIMTTNAVGNDEWVGIDDIVVSSASVAATPALSIDDVTVTEGDAGTVNATFTVSLSVVAPAPVTFDIATADNTATAADGDYTPKTLTAQTIATGSQTYSFTVVVAGDTNVESTESFFVNVTNVSGATVNDAQGTGTIANDDYSLVSIHDVQGSGNTSPVVGTIARVRGIVTAVRNNGFFLQEPLSDYDANAATSEGIFVFTSVAPPASAVVGADLTVTGTVAEFTPSGSDLSLTEITSPTIMQHGTGLPLPAPVVVTSADLTPSGGIDQLERFEGMLVTIPSITTISGTEGFKDENDATATTTGVFHAVITGTPRPFREPGIEITSPLPAGSPCCVPRWDENPEGFRVDSDALGLAPLDLPAGSTISNVVGVLDYGSNDYTMFLTSYGTVTSAASRPAAAPAANEFTVATYNLERFYDTTNNAGVDDVALTATAYDRRLAKASAGIRNFLHMPDILGVVEVENLSTLQTLATRINNDAVAASQPNPQYVAYLIEGNDPGGIDVGFLVKTAEVAPGVPRVTVNGPVVQVNPTATYVNPNTGNPDTLHDRPSLVLNATINSATAPSFPVTVINNHLRSLNDIDDPVNGNRVRVKRRAQAEDLANYVQSLQSGDPSRRIILVGDFNAFEFNDGYVDTMGTIIGQPAPATQVVLSSPDLVNPDLTILDNTLPAGERYSFEFGGNAQSLDHVVVNQALLNASPSIRMDHARINADFPEVLRNTSGAERLADHDPAIAYIVMPSPGTLAFSSATYNVNESATTFTVTVTRSGGSNGAVSADYTIAAGTAQGTDFTAGTGTVNFANGATTATFNVTINNDLLDEPAETITLTVNLTNPVNATISDAQGVVTILDDDAAPTLVVGDANVTENGGTATVTVTLSGATAQTVTVDYATANGTATAGSDYTATSGTLTFAPGTTTQSIAISIANDAVDEVNETLLVNLTNPTNATVGDAQGVVTIIDDDGAPTLVVADLNVNENAGTATVTVTLAGATAQTVTVDYATANGTATAGSDYTATSGTLTFAPGTATQSITISIANDAVDEVNETLLVNLTNPTNATISDAQGIVTIIDDDAAPTLVVADLGVNENAGTATVTVTLAGATAQTVTVDYATANGTATAGSDYTATSGTLTFAPGTATQSFTIAIANDPLDEVDETLLVNLTNPTNATISDGQAVVTIVDDDGAPSLVVSDAQVLEGNSGTTTATFNVTLVGTTSQTVTVNYATSNGTATAGSDYTATSGTLTFSPGTTTLAVNVPVLGDTTFESDETFTLTLSAPTNATIADGTGIGTIANDDVNPTADLAVTVSTTPQPPVLGQNVTFTITVVNNGPADATNLTVTDQIPAGTTFVSASSTQGTCTGTTTVNCTLGSLINGGTATVTVVVQLPASGTTFSNTVVVDSNEIDPTGATAVTTIAPAHLAGHDIPTASEWGLIALAAALAGLAVMRVRG